MALTPLGTALTMPRIHRLVVQFVLPRFAPELYESCLRTVEQWV